MQELNKRSPTVGRFVDLSTYPRRQKNKHGTHLLALALDDVVGDMVEQLDLTFHKVPELMFKLSHFGLNGDLNLLEV